MEREHRNLFFYEGVIISFDPGEDPDFTKLTIYGKSTQDGTPTPDNPVDIVSAGDDGSLVERVCGKNLCPPFTSGENNGVTFTVQSDGSVVANGTASAENDATKHIEFTLSPGTYTISGAPQNSALGVADIYLWSNEANAVVGRSFTGSTMSTFVIGKETGVSVYMRIPKNTTANNVVFKPQLELGIATAYEPYKPIQTSTITTGLPLHGIPVSEGGNVTIDGQQYIADTIEVNADGSGKVVKRTSVIDSYTDEAVEAAYLSTTGELSTGAKVIYVASVPTEIALTAEEVQSILSMQTFSPVTNVYNDEGAWQKLEGILWEADV